MNNIAELIGSFLRHIVANQVEIYNEFSLQHELGIYLRTCLPEHKVQFERNISYFAQDKRTFTKRELDIAVFSPDRKELKMAIELKFPRSGQVPEQMFSFCKDLAFAEELKAAGFAEAALLIFVDDHLFYQGPKEGIYAYFRSGKPITGLIQKPTGAKNESVTIKGGHVAKWNTLSSSIKYSLITV